MPRRGWCSSRGSGAPILIHWRKSATTAAGELALGGHRLDAVGGRDRLIKQAGVQVAGHDRRPRASRPPESRRGCRPEAAPWASSTWLEWHSWHRSTSTGRILVSKKAMPAASSAARAGEAVAAVIKIEAAIDRKSKDNPRGKERPAC